MSVPRSWDVYCRVIDNYGDAAVCWRLARTLAQGNTANPARTRLWIDDLAAVHALQPEGAIDSPTPSPAGGGSAVGWGVPVSVPPPMSRWTRSAAGFRTKSRTPWRRARRNRYGSFWSP